MDYDHNLIITPKGQYQYDPESDCYTRVPSEQDLSHWNTYSWLYIIFALTAICYTLS
jgi:hypothetical protein